MKILFLDIDGVLNRIGTKERFMGFRGLDKTLVDRYLRWKKIAQPDLDVVLSSTWRTDSLFVKHLENSGIEFIDKTPVRGDRGAEINEWLRAHPSVDGNKWAVLDDCVVKDQGGRFVQTSEVHGVQLKHLIRINKLLYDPPST